MMEKINIKKKNNGCENLFNDTDKAIIDKNINESFPDISDDGRDDIYTAIDSARTYIQTTGKDKAAFNVNEYTVVAQRRGSNNKQMRMTILYTPESTKEITINI